MFVCVCIHTYSSLRLNNGIQNVFKTDETYIEIEKTNYEIQYWFTLTLSEPI